MDGVTYSNTLFFEQKLNWTGILIEPTVQYQQLIKNRPDCKNFNYAISEVYGEVEFIGDHALGGITKTMPDGHRKGWHLDSKGGTYKVESIPMNEILKKLNISRVDLFSLDVEGGELSVLKTYDWDIPTYLVLIEMSKYNLEHDENCRNILKEKKFKFDMTIGCNELWINKNNIK